MEFDWAVRTVGEWRQILMKVPKSNWMQTWPYAQASFKRDHKISRFAIIKQNEVEIGLFSVQEIKLGPVQIINLNRGPLWFSENPSEDLFLEFAALFRKTFPKRLFQRLRWMPDWNITEDTKEKLKEIGFQLRTEYFLTHWMDLKKSEPELRKDLKQKWRNCLNKSEKCSLQIQKTADLHSIDSFLNLYALYKSEKNFHGPSQSFLKEELRTAFQAGDGFLLWSFFEGKPVAGVAILNHGNSASYRAGWNSREGRKVNAHYALLWNAVLTLKTAGIQYFDLGGLQPIEAPGVSHFKSGLGGIAQHHTILGGR